MAERAGVAPADLTLLYAPTASLAGGVQIAARVVETALHKLHELELRRPARGERLRDLPAAAGGEDRSGGDRAHERRGPLRRPGRAHRRRARRRARGARRAPALLRVGGLRRAVRQDPRGGGLGLLRDRSAAVQPGRGAARERRERTVLPRRGRAARRRSSSPSADDRRDGHDDHQPGRHRQLRGDGRGVGRRGDRHQALPRDAHAAQPRGARRGGRQPHRRHPAVHAGRARGSAPADPAGGRRRRRRARRRLLVARGHGRGDRRDRAAGARDDPRRRPRHAGASSSASTARATRSSRPRSSPRAPAGCRRTRSAPSWRAWASSWTRRPARASGRRWTASWRRCAPRSATDDDGPRRGARAAAHGHARRLRRRAAPVRRARAWR